MKSVNCNGRFDIFKFMILLLFLALFCFLSVDSKAESAGNWTQVGDFSSVENVHLVFGDGVYVAYGQRYVEDASRNIISSTLKIFRSPDGNVWAEKYSETFPGSAGIDSMQYLNGTFVAILDIHKYNQATHAGSDTMKILFSPDGTTWTTKYSEMFAGDTQCRISYLNNTFVAIIDDDYKATETNNAKIVVSPDGNVWTEKYSTVGKLGTILFQNNTFMAPLTKMECDPSLNCTTTQSILYSVDGNTWSRKDLANLKGWGWGAFDLQYLNNTYVASIVSNPENNVATARILFSTDGKTWITKYLESFLGRVSLDVKYLNDRYMASVTNDAYYDYSTRTNTAGTAKIISSSNGDTWTESYSKSISQGSVSLELDYLGGTFVAGLSNSINDITGISTATILASTDGSTWHEKYSETFSVGGVLINLQHLNDNFVAAMTTFVYPAIGTMPNKILFSPSGDVWSESYSGNRRVYVSYHNNNYFIYGSNSANGIILKQYSEEVLPYSISGAVKNISNDEGIQDAKVMVSDLNSNVVATAATNESGNYTANLSSPGDYTVKTTKHGYEMRSAPQIITVDDSNKNASANIYLSLVTASLPLSQGWNFISLPKQPSNTLMTAVLTDVSTNLRIVWGYNNQNQTWVKYVPDGTTNNLASMEQGKGYWIYMNGPGVVLLSGSSLTTTIHLYEDWNLVGYSGSNARSISAALDNISGKWNIIWGWETGVWSAKDETIIDLSVPTLSGLYQGKVYWIKIKRGMATDWTQ